MIPLSGVTITTDDIGQLVATFERKEAGIDRQTALVVNKTAHDAERIAKTLVPVDTGFLKNSIHVEEGAVHSGHTYAADLIAGANYAAFVENGTSRMAPQPFMAPAQRQVTPGFLAALAAIG